MRMLGFIDESRVLHGRQIRSFRILGGLSIVPKLVKQQGLKGIILAINSPDKTLLAQVDQLAEQYELKIYHWRVGLTEE
jgi:FlaA1/EpsC-like NDP-sugar epimerase